MLGMIGPKGEKRPGDVAAQVANVAHRFPAYGCSVVDRGLEAGDGVPFAGGRERRSDKGASVAWSKS